MSQANIWHLNTSYIGAGEDGERANEIIVTARKQGKPVYGEGPWWNVAYENVETREAALTALSIDLDEIDPGWRDVLEVCASPRSIIAKTFRMTSTFSSDIAYLWKLITSMRLLIGSPRSRSQSTWAVRRARAGLA